MRRLASLALLAALLAGCAAKPREPDWRIDAQSALERATAAYLAGDARVEAVEFDRARRALASTGQAGLVARAELTRCAVRLASLVVAPCEGFEPLRADAPAAERAYADYLAGRIASADIPLLPPQHRAAAMPNADGRVLEGIADPLARLVAAGVLFRTGRADPATLQAAVDAASQQGWRRPLLAWLGVQLQRAERAGASDEAGRLRRRIALVAGDR